MSQQVYSKLFTFINNDLFKKWLEVFFLASIVPLVGLMVNHQDPFLIEGSFTWFLVPCSLILLRFGAMYGFLSIAIYGSGFFIHSAITNNNINIQELSLVLLGPIILLAAIALISDFHLRKLKQLKAEISSKEESIKVLNKNFQLQKDAYNHLQIQLATTSNDHQDKIENFCEKFVEKCAVPPVSYNLDVIVTRLMPLFSLIPWIQSSALYLVEPYLTEPSNILSSSKKSSTGVAPITTYRNPNPPTLVLGEEPLIVNAFQHHSLSYYSPSDHPIQSDNNLVACLPICDASNKVWAILAVFECSPHAFTDEHFEQLKHYGLIAGELIKECYEEAPAQIRA